MLLFLLDDNGVDISGSAHTKRHENNVAVVPCERVPKEHPHPETPSPSSSVEERPL